ncbi:hypothetical protein JL721_11566 [Aureococcus anophagefferens]|nr:hypothetical protein JL721_11566 [Aureococcus anophagefferens]
MVLLEAARGAPVFPPNCTPVDLTQAFKTMCGSSDDDDDDDDPDRLEATFEGDEDDEG